MHIVIIGDAFPPMKTSGAVMLKDLADEFIAQGDVVSIVIPGELQSEVIHERIGKNLIIFRVKAFRTKDVSYFRRLFSEFINPYLIWGRLKKCGSFASAPIDLVVWYSPSIFWGALVARIKKQWNCPSYLILRDIFPDWAIDLGLIGALNPITFLLKRVASYQYQQANVIGVQSPNNLNYLTQQYPVLKAKVGVLWNWMRMDSSHEKCLIRVSKTSLEGKYVFVYAGNIGVAQGVDLFLRIIQSFHGHPNVGFLFVGRGSEMNSLHQKVIENKIMNVLFFPEIPSGQINDLYSQCSAGILALDGRHRTHNIPGKFVSYMHSGLPVFGLVNPGNDLINLVDQHHLGIIGNASDPIDLSEAANSFISAYLGNSSAPQRCKDFASNLFDSSQAVIEIKSALRQNSH